MRVLIQKSTMRLMYIANAIEAIFKLTGNEVTIWSEEEKPAFDIFDETNPEIVFITHELHNSSRALDKCIRERGRRIKYRPLVKIPFAADTVNFRPGKYRNEYAGDVVCIANYNEELFNDYIKKIDKSIKLKICGINPWPIPQYLGPIQIQTMPDFYASSTLCLTFGFKDEEYRILSSGGVPAVDDANNIIQPDILPHVLENKKCRQKLRQRGLENIRQGNTYWHRVAELCEGWNLNNLAKKVINVYETGYRI